MKYFSFHKKNFFSKAYSSVGSWWCLNNRLVFFSLFLVVIGMGIFSWYMDLYVFKWTSDQEKEYRLSKDIQIRFQEDKFQRILKAFDERAKKHEEKIIVFRNIFFAEEE